MNSTFVCPRHFADDVIVLIPPVKAFSRLDRKSLYVPFKEWLSRAFDEGKSLQTKCRILCSSLDYGPPYPLLSIDKWALVSPAVFRQYHSVRHRLLL
jgi:hypothetical protein